MVTSLARQPLDIGQIRQELLPPQFVHRFRNVLANSNNPTCLGREFDIDLPCHVSDVGCIVPFFLPKVEGTLEIHSPSLDTNEV